VSPYEEISDRDFELTMLDIDYDLGFADLHSSTSLFTENRIGQGDYASQGFVFYGDLGWPPLGPDFERDTANITALMTFDNEYEGLSHETRLTSKDNDDPWDWIVGIYYTEQDRNLRFNEVFPGLDARRSEQGIAISRTDGSGVDVGYAEDYGSRYEEFAVYGEVGYKITDTWHVTVGMRYFDYDDTSTAVVIDYGSSLVDADYTVPAGGSDSFYKFNTSYNFSDDWFGYYTFSQGFRRGGANGFRDTDNDPITDETKFYQPDSLDNSELGIKGYFADRKVYLQANYYQMKWNDPQLGISQSVNFFPINGTGNGADATTEGFEINSHWWITENLKVSYAGATTDAEFDEDKTLCMYDDPVTGTRCFNWEKGAKMGGAPDWKHNASILYNMEFENGMTGWVSLRSRYVGAIQSSLATVLDQDLRDFESYTLYNASFGFGKDNWDLNFWISNLTDIDVDVSVQALASGDAIGYRSILMQPRTLGVNLSWVF